MTQQQHTGNSATTAARWRWNINILLGFSGKPNRERPLSPSHSPLRGLRSRTAGKTARLTYRVDGELRATEGTLANTCNLHYLLDSCSSGARGRWRLTSAYRVSSKRVTFEKALEGGQTSMKQRTSWAWSSKTFTVLRSVVRRKNTRISCVKN